MCASSSEMVATSERSPARSVGETNVRRGFSIPPAGSWAASRGCRSNPSGRVRSGPPCSSPSARCPRTRARRRPRSTARTRRPSLPSGRNARSPTAKAMSRSSGIGCRIRKPKRLAVAPSATGGTASAPISATRGARHAQGRVERGAHGGRVLARDERPRVDRLRLREEVPGGPCRRSGRARQRRPVPASVVS